MQPRLVMDVPVLVLASLPNRHKSEISNFDFIHRLRSNN
jgi:hypothetical protein